MNTIPPEEVLLNAIQSAARAHQGQVDKAGEPYLWHVLRVGISLLPDLDAAVVGVLHDVLEDCPWTVEELRATGQTDPLIEALIVLSRKPGSTYSGYIAMVGAVPLARKVKLADLEDNLRPDRLAAAAAAGHDMAPLVKRYHDAQAYLRALVPDGSPLSVEIAYFTRMLPHWLANPDARGRFAVIQDEDLLGFFGQWEDAIRAGWRRFGVERNFLVRQVLEKQPELFVGAAEPSAGPADARRTL